MNHQICEEIERQGVEAVRQLATSKAERRLIEMRAEILADDTNALSLTYSGFCLVALPHREIPAGEKWVRRAHRMQLVVQPGTMQSNGDAIDVGIPYGSRARLILLYLQTKAVQTGQRTVELGRSMNEWLSRMGLSIGGKTYAGIREQANRISACRLSFFWDDEKQGVRGFHHDSIVRSGIQLHRRSPDLAQPSLFEETVELSETFFEALKNHPVPLQEAAVRQISNRSLSLDLYFWLAYRLHTLKKPTPIPYPALFEQFGAGFRSLRNFRDHFKEALGYALAVYPDAKVDIEPGGVRLHPSRPPVESKATATGRLLMAV